MDSIVNKTKRDLMIGVTFGDPSDPDNGVALLRPEQCMTCPEGGLITIQDPDSSSP